MILIMEAAAEPLRVGKLLLATCGSGAPAGEDGMMLR
jgi:hypothetical protein